ncbi:TonB-linked SusC/RagA family outer membrane protein [Chitinophaga niastensis]|uniref:TonB-linked SusC/RagA family outer membrane protein n=1 Tax=Chitinophaga niastensis TaxID=536980 RepID=A0A2P8HCH5_CHINA|nr:TonB-dependent receptor [Chitinophaga niastensis]PSL43918.1 TonB-linked SusC/RagA family outer membrane protein [Chitinophaga niastensis]
MKLTFVLLITAFLHVAASSYAQKITIAGKNVSLDEVLKKISTQTGYNFIYTDQMLQDTKPMDVQFRNASLEDVLVKCFDGQPLTYAINQKTIVIRRKPKPDEPSPPPVIITGKVTAVNNEPLVGVSIRVKGTTIGTNTNAGGTYTLKVPGNEAVLVYSYVGYISQERKVSSGQEINITLVEDPTKLNEVIVVAYGTQKTKYVTNAVSSIKSKDIANVPVSSTDALLQGRAAGVQVIQNSGQPGGAITVRVRGITSINAGNSPLYVVDGVPVQSGNPSSLAMGTTTNSIAAINPNDIESLEVLKDASAASLYGSRAANGVVLITTKRGKSGAPAVTLNYYTGFQKDIASKRPKKINNCQYIELIEEQRANALSSGLGSLYAFVIPDSSTHINTDWLGAVLRSAPISNYDLSIRGGNEKLRYALSGGYFNQDGVVLGTNFKRYNLRINTDYEATPRLKIGNSLSLSRSVYQRVPGEDDGRSVIRVSLYKAVVLPVYNGDGSYYVGDPAGYSNPVMVATQDKMATGINSVIGNVYGEYQLLKGFNFRTTWGVDFSGLKDDAYKSATDLSLASGISNYSQYLTTINENTLNYKFAVKDKHHFNTLLGYSIQQRRAESTMASASNFSTGSITTINAAGTLVGASSFNSASGIESMFSRIGYDFNNKYLVELSLRNDGSSKFGKNNKYALFPAASVGWRVSDEPFLKRLKALSDLKIRASIGKTGNDNIGDYRSQGVYATGRNYNGYAGVAPSDLPNADLKWETTTQYNAGVDASFFDARLSFSVDAYIKKTKDLLLDVELPSSAGIRSSLQNVGSTENRGVELNINTINISAKQFKWSSNFNISFNKNVITGLAGGGKEIIISKGGNIQGASNPLSILKVGDAIGAFYGWHTSGVYAYSADNKKGIRDLSSTGYLFRGGDEIFEDRNGDGIIDNNDRVIIGNALPKFTGGFSNNLSYKGFELNVFTQFSYGNQIYNGSRAVVENMYAFAAAGTGVLKRWRKEGDVTNVPRADHGDPGNNRRASERWIEDGSYLRIKTVTLGYNLSPAITQKMKIQSLRFYVTAQNLFTLTSYTGWDPEVSAFGSSVTDLGIDYGNYPQCRTFTLGATLGF